MISVSIPHPSTCGITARPQASNQPLLALGTVVRATDEAERAGPFSDRRAVRPHGWTRGCRRASAAPPASSRPRVPGRANRMP